MECSYKVTIEGVTTLPNALGQDMVVLSGNAGGGGAEEYLAFQIVQSKGGGSDEAVSWTGFIKATLDRDLAPGEYPVLSMASGSFSSTDPSLFPLYSSGELSDTDGENVDMTFTLLENSDKRVRMKLGGMAMKTELVDGSPVELGKVPVEAEISFPADLLSEVVIEGNTALGGICECQDQ